VSRRILILSFPKRFFALLLNEHTKTRHPGFLIHDNVFEVDQDTLINSLKFIIEKTKLAEQQQYILTLNSDRLENAKQEPWYKFLDENVRAKFTKTNRFLKLQYQETH